MKTITFDASLGCHINEFTQRLVEHWEYLAPKMQDAFCVSGEFNGVTLTTTGKETSAMLYEHFCAELKKQAEAYERSPEYKEAQERRKIEVATLQKKHDELASGLSAINFNDYNSVLDFVHQ